MSARSQAMHCDECTALVYSAEIRRDAIDVGTDSPHIAGAVSGPAYVVLSPCGHQVHERAGVERFQAWIMAHRASGPAPQYIGKVRERESEFMGATSVTVEWALGECEASAWLDIPRDGNPAIYLTIGETYPAYGDIATEGHKFTPEQARALAHDLPLLLTELADRAEGPRP